MSASSWRPSLVCPQCDDKTTTPCRAWRLIHPPPPPPPSLGFEVFYYLRANAQARSIANGKGTIRVRLGAGLDSNASMKTLSVSLGWMMDSCLAGVPPLLFSLHTFQPPFFPTKPPPPLCRNDDR